MQRRPIELGTEPEMELGVAILAAGASTRMGQPKMLLPWEGTSVIGHIIRVWTEALNAKQVAVVCAPAPSPVPAELNRLHFPPENRITNPEPERGMFSSIQVAADWLAWKSELSHFALVLGDQPHISVQTLQKLLAAAQENPSDIVQPAFNGRPRHPVIIPAPAFRSLATTKHLTLRDFLATPPKTLVELGDPGLNLDLDYPADYQRAREQFSRLQ